MVALYTFDRSTKHWLFGELVEQQLDVISGEPIPLRNATDKEVIPEKNGHVRGFVTGKWEYYVDNRGKEYWGADGTKHTIAEVGEEVPEGALLEEPIIPPTEAELSATARAKRDALLNGIAWRYERNAREARLGIETTDSIEALDAYTQALADVPQQEGFPTTIEWPALPT